MKVLVTPILISLCALLACASTFAQTAVVVTVGAVKGRVASVNPSTNAMTVLVEPGDRRVNFSGVERARIERPRG